MAILSNAGNTYSSGDPVTAANLNAQITGATFEAGDGEAADGTTLQVHPTLGYLKIKDGGVDTTQLAAGAVTSAQLDATFEVTGGEIADDAVTAAKISATDGTFNVDSANTAVGIGIAHEDAYALKTSKLKIEGTATQMYIKDSDESGTPTEIAISLNEKALRFGFQDSPSTQAFAIFGRNITIAGGTVAELNALTADDGALLHQVAVCSNGNSGQPCLAMYTGVHGSGGSWKILATVGSAISA